jgi:hypothetical protein
VKSFSIASTQADDRTIALDLSQLVPQVRTKVLEARLTFRG